MAQTKQLDMFQKQSKSYGGELRKTSKGRSGPRPLDHKGTMHLVMRSSKAKGDWSFRYKDNPRRIKEIVNKFAGKYGIKVLSLANVSNHLHFHIKLASR